MKFKGFISSLLVLFVIVVPTCQATAYISIVIDDLGYNLHEGIQLINLPGKLTYSILPSSPYGKQLAQLAHQQNKEIMLHLPMQSESKTSLDPGMLTVALSESEFKQTLHNNLQSIPYIAGINNHMGSHLTRHFRQMDWLMQELALTPLYFIDSRTTPRTVATYSAGYHDVPTLRRDIFLDNSKNPSDIAAQLEKLKRTALKQGYALAIGHPYAATLTALKHFLSNLNADFQLVPVSELIRIARPSAQTVMMTTQTASQK